MLHLWFLLYELREEKIDVVEWSEDPVQYIASSLSPATVLAVDINEEEMATLLGMVEETIHSVYPCSLH